MICKNDGLALARQMHIDIDALQMDDLIIGLKDSCLSIKKIEAIEVTNITPAPSIVMQFASLRPDNERPSLKQAKALLNATTKEKGFITIP